MNMNFHLSELIKNLTFCNFKEVWMESPAEKTVWAEANKAMLLGQ